MTGAATFELVLVLVAGALAVSAVASRLGLPPAAALVISGLVLALSPGLPSLSIEPDLILVLFLPLLLMSSAFETVWRDLRAELVPVLLMSVGAVAFTTFCVGLAAHLAVPSLPMAACFALGAVVSPPDAVAAKSVLQRLRLPRRLTTILEGESLVNDAAGLVLYRFTVAAAITGAFSPLEAAGSFAWLAIGGIVVGLAVGALATIVVRRVRDVDLAVSSTLFASWAAYIGAERVGASGVLAVVSCGVFFGLRQHEEVDAGVRMQAAAVWRSIVYVLEAFVFVLIGLALRGVLGHLDGAGAASALPLSLAATAAVVLSRLAWVFPASLVPRLLRPSAAREKQFTLAFPLIVGWAGMRGIVTLAVALALPENFPGRAAVLIAAFAVILFTVLVQGTTLGPLIERLQLPARAPDAGEMDEAGARAAVSHASLEAVEAMVGDDGPLHPKLVEEYQMRAQTTARLRDAPDVTAPGRREHFIAALVATAAGRSELNRLHREEAIHESVLAILEQDLDLEELRLRRLAGLTRVP